VTAAHNSSFDVGGYGILRGRGDRYLGAAFAYTRCNICVYRVQHLHIQGAAFAYTETHSKEVDKLRSDLTDCEQQLVDAKEGSTRAEEAEAELQQLTNKTARTVPLNVHDQVVRICVVFQIMIHSGL
jgi:hypothetical protein